LKNLDFRLWIDIAIAIVIAIDIDIDIAIENRFFERTAP